MILLSDRNNGTLLGEISKADFTVIHEILEEESDSDVDYYIQETALELLSQAGLSPDAHLLLTNALGDHADLEFGWESPQDSDTGLRGRILAPGPRPAPGLAVEARAGSDRFWTFTREDGSFELKLPPVSRAYTLRVAAIGDKEIWSEANFEVEAGSNPNVGDLPLDVEVDEA